ncbi:MAG: deoxyribodipyrimidine photo-lyase [Microbacterium sp.]|uniref:cryptochrome/photolyase family protein n=1 Tax=Microbacterium sp. TaxID=51671 RepID=UPI001AC78FD1|nr:deoxyribodipyrimidine photo-lyase [Microbacterium sp.]MBN9176499.1 deoxyribodipyrimidine photo-lyase [Microbacterium sp.]
MPSPSLVWFRDDLRLADNPALRAAVDRDEPIIGVYLLDEESPGIRPLGGAARWWLHHSLAELGERLREKGSALVLRRGAAADVLPALVQEAGAGAVYWNRRYGGAERGVDAGLKETLRADGIEVSSFAASVLFEPWTVRTGAGTPYGVFTPFWNACRQLPPPREPLPEPRELRRPGRHPASDALDDWGLVPTAPDWAAGLRERWQPGEVAARARLDEFLREDAADYDRARDEPAGGATSLLSPRLRWGELSPHAIWHAAVSSDAPVGGFLSELGWREFAWHILFHFPELATKNLRSAFDAFPWPRLHPTRLRAWQRGETGYPLVDAGMRELWRSGYMHNRVRMVTASFLVKNLLIDWRRGEEWFWDTLVDADAASNPFNWQWVAGSGADAAPYFRIFNPELQAKKFDPDRRYIREWAPDAVDDDAREPIVDLAETRKAALAAYEVVKRA